MDHEQRQCPTCGEVRGQRCQTNITNEYPVIVTYVPTEGSDVLGSLGRAFESLQGTLCYW